MNLSSQEIRQLTDLWYQTFVQPNGYDGFGAEQYRLHLNGVAFHELDYDALCTACTCLTKQLLLPGRNSFMNLDHFLLWSWVAELLLERPGPLSHSVDREISQLAETAARAALTNAARPMRPREAFEYRAEVDRLLNRNANYLINHSYIVLSYISFPLLEAVVRRACPTYVDMNGVVQQPFEKANGKLYAVGARCNSVGDMLRLLRDRVAGHELKNNLIEILSHIEKITGVSDGCSVIYDWRNSSLHGETTHQEIGGTVFGLSLIIALSDIEDRYVQLRDAAAARAQQQQLVAQLSASPSPFGFYPPF